jgi:hypothetical protein
MRAPNVLEKDKGDPPGIVRNDAGFGKNQAPITG